jgi:Ca2+-binding RTX toxin-like protein
MAIFTVLNSTGQSTDNLWPSGAAGVTQVLTSNTSSYWILLSNGTYVRYSGSSLQYTNNGGLPIPFGGTYSLVEITDSFGSVLATLDGFGSEPASNITQMPAATVLGAIDAFTGSSGADSLMGYSGNDTFNITSGADLLDGGQGDDIFVLGAAMSAGPNTTLNQTIIGGNGFDTLQMHLGTGPHSMQFSVDFDSIEQFEFVQDGLAAGSFVTLFNADEIGAGISENLNVIGSIPADGLTLAFVAGSSGSYSLARFTFQNWFSKQRVELFNDSSGVVTWTGSSVSDYISVGNAGDSFSGGDGNDVVNFQNTSLLYSGQFIGGADTGDEIRADANGSTIDIKGTTISGFEKLYIGYQTTLQMMAAQAYGFANALSVNTGDGGQTLSISMGGESFLHLENWTFGEWKNNDHIFINGSINSETVYGTTKSDVFSGGGGADVFYAGDGDDTFVMRDGIIGDVTFNLWAMDGGTGSNTISLSHNLANGTGVFDLTNASLTSIQNLTVESGTNTALIKTDSDQYGSGFASNLAIAFDNTAAVTLEINMQSTSFSAAGLQIAYSNFDSNDLIRIVDSSSANDVGETIAGSNFDDEITVRGFAENFVNAGAGDDSILLYDGANGGNYNGGNGTDRLTAFRNEYSTLGVNSAFYFSIEELAFANGTGSGLLQWDVTAGFAGAVLSTSNIVDTRGGSQASILSVVHYAFNYLTNLSGLTFENWGSEDYVKVTADDTWLYDRTIIGSSVKDVIYSGMSNDTVNGGSGADELDGGAGMDTLSYASSSAYVIVDISANTASGGDATGDVISNFENLTGSAFGDVLKAAAGSNTILGGAGQDSIVIGNGLAGDFDVLDGGTERDLLDMSGLTNGGIWIDYGYNVISGPNMASGFNLSMVAGEARVVNMDSMVGTSFNDTMRGDAGSNLIDGGAGNDILLSYSPYDTLTPYSSLGDVMLGGTGDDLLFSGTGNDYLDGGADNDTLEVGGGTDTVVTGTGNDTIFFSPRNGTDTVTDFTGGAGVVDVLKLYGFGTSFDTFAEVFAVSSQVGANTQIALTDTTIILQNFTRATLVADDFVFV